MANRWGNNGNSDRFYLGAPKPLQMLTAAMKLRLSLLRRKAMTNLDSILTSRDITLSTKVQLVKAMVFPVVRYGCQSWTIKKAECRRIGEGNGNPPQCSCLENPRDRGAWWAAIYGVA